MKELLGIVFGPVPVLLGLCLALVAVLRLSPAPSVAGRAKLTAKRLLTGNETEFLHRLRRALPGLEVVPQVAMGALLDVNLAQDHPAYWLIREQFAMKVIDYVVCRGKGLDVVAVVELDDRTHDSKRSKDSQRDAMLLSVGIRTVRWDSRAKPSEAEIARRFQALLVGPDKHKAV